MIGKPATVRPELEALLKESAERVLAMTPSAREKMIRRQIEGAARAEASWNEDATVIFR